MKSRLQMILLLVGTSFVTNALAQEVSIPDPGLNAAIRETLAKPVLPLTVLDLLSLTNLDASFRGVSSLEGLGAAHNLTSLDLRGMELTNLTFPAALTNLTSLDLGWSELTNLTLPADLTRLTTLDLGLNELTSLTLPAGLTNLTSLNLYHNQLTGLRFPEGLPSLTTLYLELNQLTDFSFLSGLPSLTTLNLDSNQLTDFSFLSGLPSLITLYLGGNQLSSLTLPSGLTNLTSLGIAFDQLTNLTLTGDLTSLTTLELDRRNNPLLRIFVLPEQLTATGLADEVASLTSQGVTVYAYPVTVSLVSAQRTMAETFELTLTGPPGTYAIRGSADLTGWRELGTVTNALGTVLFTEPAVKNSLQNFYMARTAP